MPKTIGELEGLDADTQFILEVAAITHDIVCPLCRKKVRQHQWVNIRSRRVPRWCGSSWRIPA